MKKRSCKLLALAMALSLTACGGNGGSGSSNDSKEAAAASGNVHRDTVTVAIANEPKTLIPYGSNDTATGPVTHQIYEPLIKLDENMNKVAGLATEWEQVDDTHYHFKLREGVKFHNGNDFTAEDVLYTFEQNTSNASTASTIGPVDIANCVVEDDYNITIAMSEPYPAFLNCCTLDIAAIIDKETMEADPDAYAANPVGTGPFKFVEWATGDNIRLEANDEWWGGEINFDTLILRYIPEGSTRAIEAESGGVDIAHITVSDADNADASAEVNLQVNRLLSTSYLSFNCSIEPFNNTKVRQAISLAIDSDAIVKAAYRGYADTSKSFLAPDNWGYKDVESEYNQYDVERAKELLAEAGYPDGFTCTLVSNSNQTVAEMIQAYLKEIGITVELNVTDFANWLDAITNGKQQMYLGGWTVSSGDASEAFAAFHSANMGPTNRSFYSNPEADALIDTIDSETDEQKRMDACIELQEILGEECVTVPTQVGIGCYAVNKSISNFYVLPTQSYEFAYMTFAD